MTYDNMDRMQSDVVSLIERAFPGPWEFRVVVPERAMTPAMRAATEALAQMAPMLAQAVVDAQSGDLLAAESEEAKRENDDLTVENERLEDANADLRERLHAAEERIQVLVRALAEAGAEVPPAVSL